MMQNTSERLYFKIRDELTELFDTYYYNEGKSLLESILEALRCNVEECYDMVEALQYVWVNIDMDDNRKLEQKFDELLDDLYELSFVE